MHDPQLTLSLFPHRALPARSPPAPKEEICITYNIAGVLAKETRVENECIRIADVRACSNLSCSYMLET